MTTVLYEVWELVTRAEFKTGGLDSILRRQHDARMNIYPDQIVRMFNTERLLRSYRHRVGASVQPRATPTGSEEHASSK